MNHTTAEILNKYETYFSASHRAVLENRGHAIVEDRREGDCIYDLDGKRYIDCISSLSIHNLGRRPAAIVEELRKAIQETDQGNFPMISEEKATLAEKISRFVPAKLEASSAEKASISPASWPGDPRAERSFSLWTDHGSARQVSR
jgi:4-aminobutyrate aminotransferase-like enzyme